MAKKSIEKPPFHMLMISTLEGLHNKTGCLHRNKIDFLDLTLIGVQPEFVKNQLNFFNNSTTMTFDCVENGTGAMLV